MKKIIILSGSGLPKQADTAETRGRETRLKNQWDGENQVGKYARSIWVILKNQWTRLQAEMEIL